MTGWDANDVARWLAAERAGAADEADALCAVLIRRVLPPFEPPARLVERVMAAVPWRGTMADPLASPWARSLAAMVLLVIGVGLSAASPGILFGAASEAAGPAARLLHALTTSAGAALGVMAAACGLLATLGRAAAIAATTGAAPLIITANVLLAIASFVGLQRLLAAEEECS